MLRLRLALGLVAALCVVTLAYAPASLAAGKKAAAADEDDDEEEDASDKAGDKGGAKGGAKASADDDDDILAPVDNGAKAPAAVEAQKTRDLKVGVLPLVPLGDASKTLADQVTSDFTRALNESASVEFSALGLPSTGGGPTVDPATYEQARKEGEAQLGKARAALDKQQLGKARQAFEKAVAAFGRAAPVLVDSQPLIDAWVGLAECAARGGDEDEAKKLLGNAASFNPERELDKKKYPNLFVSMFREARDDILRAPRGKILVDETAVGAVVEVDGRRMNNAPVRVLDVPAGPHLVRAVREGQSSWGVVVDVKGGDENTLSPGFLAKDKRGPVDDLSQNRFSPGAASTVAAAAKAAGLKAAVVGAVAKVDGKVVVQLVLVDAASAHVLVMPGASVQSDLLDVAIESLKPRERIEETLAAAAPELGEADETESLIEGARAGAGAQLSEVKMRFDVRVSREPPRARGGSKPATKSKLTDADKGDEDDDVVESSSGSRRTLDEGDRLSTGNDDDGESMMSQSWFMPTVVSAGIAGIVVLGGGTVAGLIAAGVLPDPRPAAGARVQIELPQ